jgi:hypothetical protein
MKLTASVLALLGCGATPAQVTWGVAASCHGAKPTSGFAPAFDGSDGVVVFADAEQETAADLVKETGFERRRVSELRPADRARNLVVIGTYDDNPVLRDLNGSLPVWFEHGRFTFGGYRYDDANDGIALVHPSPFAPGRFVVIYAGNSPGGVELTQTVPTGDHQFVTVGLPLGIEQQGELCDDGTRWRFHAAFASDGRRDWEAFRAGLDRVETAHDVFYWLRGSKAARDGAAITAEVEADHQKIIEALHVEEPDRKIVTYLWSDRATKAKFTGDSGNGESIDNVVHAIYNDEVSALGPHEYVHAIANARLPSSSDALLMEGLAVMIQGQWQGQSLDDAVAALHAQGKLVGLKQLASFRSIDDNISYPIAGHFVRFLVTRFGIDKIKALYGAPELRAGIEQILHVDPDQLEADWVATIR